jgi:uncharacterized HAD superfamily protein
MLFAIDIDGTIAGTDHGREYVQYLNRVLGMGMSEEKIAAFASYREFALSAEVQAFGALSQENQDRYMAALEDAQYDAGVQRASLPLPHAVEGIMALSTYGRIIYVTCRYESSRDLSQEWLAQYGFPNPEQVFTCERFHHKYVEAQKHAFADEPIILIDDHAEDVLKTFRRLVKEYYHIAKSVYGRFGLVAFGTDKAPAVPNQLRIPMLALPSWGKEEIQQLIGVVL